MSYTPTDWKTGDTIFAEQLNNMESGIGKAGSVYLVKVMNDEGGTYSYLDTNFRKIKNAIEYGSLIVLLAEQEGADNVRLLIPILPEGIDLVPAGGGVVHAGGYSYEAINDVDNPKDDGGK